MTEIPDTVEQEPSPPAPFSPTAPRGEGAGCSRVGIIGCGLLTLLLGAAAIMFLLKAGDLFAWAMTRFEAEIIRALPEDLTEAERQRLHEAFSAATEAVRSGDFDPLALQRLQSKLRESILSEGDQLSREQILELIALLEEVAGAAEDSEPQEDAAGAGQVAVLGGA